jgi:predicted nucleic acid-binding protein
VIVLDTNVLSEVLRPIPDAKVRRWLERQAGAAMFTTAICEAEILYGIALMPAGRRRRALEQAAAAIFQEDFAGRILPFDRAAAREFAGIAAGRLAAGRRIGDFDAQIAAIARSRGAVVATRNVADFSDCGIDVIDPWKA